MNQRMEATPEGRKALADHASMMAAPVRAIKAVGRGIAGGINKVMPKRVIEIDNAKKTVIKRYGY